MQPVSKVQGSGLHCMYYAKLKPDPIIFEPLNSFNNVFFDPANKQIFCLRSGGQLGVTVKGPDTVSLTNFRMDENGTVLSVKFSPNNKILALQRSETSVEFLNFNSTLDVEEYSQPCKSKSAKLQGFVWTSSNEVLYVANNGLELYQVIPEKKSFRLLKTISLQINWFCWQHETEILVVSTGTVGNTLHVFQIKPQGVIIKLPKFEVDPPMPASRNTPPEALKQKDCILISLYGHVYVCILKKNMWGSGKSGTEIVMYKVMRENPAKKTHILVVDVDGRIAVNVVDNLVIVHHQTSKTSFLYDIGLESRSDGFSTVHNSVVSPLPIEPCNLSAKCLPAYSDSANDIEIPMYASSWIVFTPDMIIDGEIGCMWYLTVDSTPIVEMMTDKSRLIDYLVNRDIRSKELALKVCREIIHSGNRTQLSELAKIFDRFCKVYKSSLSDDVTADINSSALATKSKFKRSVVIDQEDIFNYVFVDFIDPSKNIEPKFATAILTEYIRSCNDHYLPVQNVIFETVIKLLIKSKSFFQLHQFIQYHALTDSKQIACLLLSLESVYPPAYQLALDILKRLKTANEEIVEVLLSKHYLFEAIRFLRSQHQIDNVSARKYLEVAKQTENSQTFYSVFKFFERRNILLRENPRFAPGEHCDAYVKHFISLFGNEALEPASG